MLTILDFASCTSYKFIPYVDDDTNNINSDINKKITQTGCLNFQIGGHCKVSDFPAYNGTCCGDVECCAGPLSICCCNGKKCKCFEETLKCPHAYIKV